MKKNHTIRQSLTHNPAQSFFRAYAQTSLSLIKTKQSLFDILLCIIAFELVSLYQNYQYWPTSDQKMRQNSQRLYSNSTQKPEFQTKYKLRSGTQKDPSHLHDSLNIENMGQTQRSFHNHQESSAKNEIFAQTASKLSDSNFMHHDQQSCLCNECHCGRHLCKLHVIKPDLTKKTIYQHSFYQQKPVPNIVNHDKQYDKLKGPHLDLCSTYTNGFKGKSGDKQERPHPQDLLHSNGPCPQLSSYSAQFPGYRGDNQYVKPTDKYTRGYYPLKSKSTYSKEFVPKDPKKDDYSYISDQLKTGYRWLGKTTYGDFFSNPNPEYFAKKAKIVEKKEDNPNFNRQYQTIYKNDFVPKKNPLCPSKIFAETKAQGAFNDSKVNFSENSDFKAFSPDFHAISTSKHTYV